MKTHKDVESLLVTMSARVLEKQVIIVWKVFLGTFVERVVCMVNEAGIWNPGVKGNGIGMGMRHKISVVCEMKEFECVQCLLCERP